MKKIFLPDFFILGAAKCGTTALFLYMKQMEDVCMSEPKEPYFFECEYEMGLDFYQQKYFSHWKGEKIIGDARQRNLYLPYVPGRIHEVNPEARLVIILRDPADRAFSHWWQVHSRNRIRDSFEKCIDDDLKTIEEGWEIDTPERIATYCEIPNNIWYRNTFVDSGYYMNQVDRYLKYFRREQMQIFLLEDLERDPLAVVNTIRAWLQLPSTEKIERVTDDRISKKQRNAPKWMYQLARRSGMKYLFPQAARRRIAEGAEKILLPTPSPDPQLKKKLQQHFAPYNNRLADFLKRDLSHWNG